MTEPRFEIIPQEDVPKKTQRSDFLKIREIINDKLKQVQSNQGLKVENYPWNVQNALRRYYLTHGYPNTCMRKHILYIRK